MSIDPSFTAADLEYLVAEYASLEDLCRDHGRDPVEIRAAIDAGGLPRATYELPDGRSFFPGDYFDLLDGAGGVAELRACFEKRLRDAVTAAGLEFTDEWTPESEWTDYVDGTYSVCLWDTAPETIVAKERLIRTIQACLDSPEPESSAWRSRLRLAVAGLDEIERPFTDFDRARWEYTTRGRYITDVRARYPAVFEA